MPTPEQPKKNYNTLGLVVYNIEDKTTKGGAAYVQVRAFEQRNGEYIWWDVQCYGPDKMALAKSLNRNQRIFVNGPDASSEWNGKTYNRVWAQDILACVPVAAADSDDIPF